MKRMISLLLLMLSFAVQGDLRSPTGKPLLDFYTAYGALDAVKIINELCNEHYPEYTKQNDNAYQAWRQRNKQFIYKLEQYNHAIMVKIAKGNPDSLDKQMRDTLLQYENTKDTMRKQFADLGPDIFRSSCEVYPEYTTSNKADMPVYYKEHIQVFEEYWRKKPSN